MSLDPASRSFTYKILSGAPMRDHLGKAEFVSKGSGTEIRWSGQFKPKIPGIGWVVARVARRAVNQYLDAVEKAAR